MNPEERLEPTPVASSAPPLGVTESSVINSPHEELQRHFVFDNEGITNQSAEGRCTSAFLHPDRPAEAGGGPAPELVESPQPHDPVARFDTLPRRVFLDSSTLQTLYDYGGAVFECEDPPRDSRAYSIPDFLDDLGALRLIFLVNERAMFDMVLSQGSLDEVDARGHPGYTRWALDVLDHWLVKVEEYGGSGREDAGARFDGHSLGYLSAKDARLLRDALTLECDAFLTMEKNLVKNAAHVEASIGLKVLRPPDYWALLRPWAALYL